MIFHYGKWCPVIVPGCKLHIVELISVHSGSTQSAYFFRLLPDHGVLPCFLYGCFIIKSVDDIQIQIIRSQTFQASVDFPHDGFSGKTARVKINLGRDHNVISGNVIFQRTAKIFLAGSC